MAPRWKWPFGVARRRIPSGEVWAEFILAIYSLERAQVERKSQLSADGKVFFYWPAAWKMGKLASYWKKRVCFSFKSKFWTLQNEVWAREWGSEQSFPSINLAGGKESLFASRGNDLFPALATLAKKSSYGNPEWRGNSVLVFSAFALKGADLFIIVKEETLFFFTFVCSKCCFPSLPGVVRSDGFSIEGGAGFDVLVLDMSVLHAQRSMARSCGKKDDSNRRPHLPFSFFRSRIEAAASNSDDPSDGKTAMRIFLFANR